MSDLVQSGFHYIYDGTRNVFLMFYDEVSNKDYPICSVKDLSVADELVYFLQNAYRRVCSREGGVPVVNTN